MVHILIIHDLGNDQERNDKEDDNTDVEITHFSSPLL